MMRDLNTSRTYLKTDRASRELRRGGLVLLRLSNGAACLLQAAELASDATRDEMQRLAGSGAVLILTETRMDSLGRQLEAEFCGASLPAHNLGHDRIGQLAVEQPADGMLDGVSSLVGERRGSLADYATRLLRIAKLLPAALVTRLPTRDAGFQQRLHEDNNLIVINDRDIDGYMDAAAQSLSITARARVPLRVAPEAEVVMFRAKLGGDEHFAVIVGQVDAKSAPLVRLHSQCITGDVLGSLKCDCGDQLQGALALMAEAGGGILVYLAQEGRDIGLLNKMRAYALQDNGFDTIDANHALGFEMDERHFMPACRILEELGVSRLKLITNNPDKIAQMEAGGFTVVERVPMTPPSNEHNNRYIETKRDRAGHMTD
ncbi:MAG: GTP cyclohydrolase II [Pseudomonadota bacterium]|nr:GTP cyclohydrolase II [Pseudomonadota bacterium]